MMWAKLGAVLIDQIEILTVNLRKGLNRPLDLVQLQADSQECQVDYQYQSMCGLPLST